MGRHHSPDLRSPQETTTTRGPWAQTVTRILTPRPGSSRTNTRCAFETPSNQDSAGTQAAESLPGFGGRPVWLGPKAPDGGPRKERPNEQADLRLRAHLLGVVGSREEKYCAPTTSKGAFLKVRPRPTPCVGPTDSGPWLRPSDPGKPTPGGWRPTHPPCVKYCLLHSVSLRGVRASPWPAPQPFRIGLQSSTSCVSLQQPPKAHTTHSTPDVAPCVRKAFLNSARPPDATEDWEKG